MVQKFSGEISIPGSEDRFQSTVILNADKTTAYIDFDKNIAGQSQICSKKFSFITRPKYDEIIFTTSGIPEREIELIWKLNASHIDGTVAGIVIAQPNSKKIAGEKGFILESDNS